ncbi:hypothetical protein CCR75_004869 [Bremia lactucae]|uniref:Uncharacterized protein n=1 Tax=Bremia lactucae TaxID=4779 RepID=A0A976IIK1_BRELC|nr:hypothetical protein CCR75_004869 [Bremia lactucae]
MRRFDRVCFNPPIMTLEEYADKEMTGATREAKKSAVWFCCVKILCREAPQEPRMYDQLLEDGDENDEGLTEEATYKDRAWDDWKGAIKKGIGNKKGSQF